MQAAWRGKLVIYLNSQSSWLGAGNYSTTISPTCFFEELHLAENVITKLTNKLNSEGIKVQLNPWNPVFPNQKVNRNEELTWGIWVVLPLPVSPTMIVVAWVSTKYRMAVRYLYTGSLCLCFSVLENPNLFHKDIHTRKVITGEWREIW